MSRERSALYATDTVAVGLLDSEKGEYSGYQVIRMGKAAVAWRYLHTTSSAEVK
jgi:hypothetical protein